MPRDPAALRTLAKLADPRPPTLRYIALTAPYMRDGSLATLDDVLDHYARGGIDSPLKSEHITGFTLSERDRADFHAFFASLTDHELVNDPRFASPW